LFYCVDQWISTFLSPRTPFTAPINRGGPLRFVNVFSISEKLDLVVSLREQCVQ